MRRTGGAVVVLALVVAAVSAAPAPAQDLVVRGTADGILALGPFSVQRSPTLRHAISALGRPTSRRKVHHGNGCRVRWKRLGLLIDFENFGFAGSHVTACTPRVGLAQQAAIGGTGSDSWTTPEGLRIGSPLDALTGLYPGAQPQPDGSYWLVVGQTTIGCEETVPCPLAVLTARTDGAAVTSLRVWIGAAGE